MVEIFGNSAPNYDPAHVAPKFHLWANEGYDFPRKLNPSAVDILQGAANNFPVLSFINRMRHAEHVPDGALEFDQDFDPFSRIKGTPYEAFSHAFIGARSEKDFENIASYLDTRNRQRAEQAERPWLAFGANALLMTTDPATYVGGTMIWRMNKLMKAQGRRSYLQAGAIFGASQAPGEGVRHLVDPTVTKEESAMILGASTLFGMLGGRFTRAGDMESQVFEQALKRQEAEYMARRTRIRQDFEDPVVAEAAGADLPMFGRRWSRQDQLNKDIEASAAFKEAEAGLRMEFAWPAARGALERTLKIADDLGISNEDIIAYLVAGKKFSGARGKFDLGIIDAKTIRSIAAWKRRKNRKSPYDDYWSIRDAAETPAGASKPKPSTATPSAAAPPRPQEAGPVVGPEISAPTIQARAGIEAELKQLAAERALLAQQLRQQQKQGKAEKDLDTLTEEIGDWQAMHTRLKSMDAKRTQLEKELDNLDSRKQVPPDSVGAAATPGRPIPGAEAHKPTEALGLEKINLTPQQRTANSEFASVGDTAQMLFEVPWVTKGMEMGVAAPISVAQRMRNYLYPIAEAINEMEKSFLAHRLQSAKESSIGQFLKVAQVSLKDRIKGPGTNELSLGQFKEAVGKTIITGKKHPVAEVNRMAQWWKDTVYNPIGKEAVDVGLLPAHALKKNYFNRIWNHGQIRDQRPAFEGMLSEWFGRYPQHLPAKLTPAQAARQLVDKLLMDRPFSPFSEFEIGAASPLHKIAIEIENTFTSSKGISVMDFMITDVEVAGRTFSRIMSSDIELARAFAPLDDLGKIGPEQAANGVRMEASINTVLKDGFDHIGSKFPKFSEKIELIGTRYLAAREQVYVQARRDLAIGQDPVQIRTHIENQIKKLEDSLIETMKKQTGQRSGKSAAELLDRTKDLLAMRDLIRGTFGQPLNPSRLSSRVMKGGRTFTAFTMLSGPLWSAVPDLAMPILHEGLKRTWGVTFQRLSNTFDKNLMQLGAKEGRLAGEALDMQLATRALAITDFADISGRFTVFERSLDAANSFAFVANLFNPWNTFFKDHAGLIIQSRLLETSIRQTKGLRISKRDTESLLRGTISRDTAEIITKQFEKWGRKEGNIYIANTEAWSKDAATQQAILHFRAALSSDIRRTIITPSKSDLPLWVSTEVGGVIAALKTFSFASIQKVAIPALQARDQQALVGIAMLTALGVLVHELKRKQRDDDRYETVGQKILAGIERGGWTGPFMDVNKMIEMVSNNHLGLNPLIGSPQIDTSTLSKVGAVGGPVVTQAGRLVDIMGDVVSGNIDDSTMNSARRLFPLQAVPMYDGMYDAVFRANRHQPEARDYSGAGRE
ncbi:MAG: hypothetical protein CME71_11855 [Halobacteriovorax sp.]|nr:hypothetical protein [Halobacteriovorax sp.]